MILLKKSGKRSIHIEFDRAGALELEAAFSEPPREVSALVDRALLGGRQTNRGEFIEIPLQVSPSTLDEVDTISFRPDKVSLQIDADSAAYVRHRLQSCAPNGFFPAEIGEVSMNTEEDIVSLYGEYKEPLSLT